MLFVIGLKLLVYHKLFWRNWQKRSGSEKSTFSRSLIFKTIRWYLRFWQPCCRSLKSSGIWR